MGSLSPGGVASCCLSVTAALGGLAGRGERGLPGGALSAPFALDPTAPCSGRPQPAQRSLWLWFQVVFGKTLPAFATIPLHQLQHEKKYDIYFMDGRVFALYR